MEALVIGLIRVAGSLPVLRWAFVGGLIAVFVDLSDLFLRDVLDLGGIGNYQEFDKWVDQVYVLTFLWVAWRWDGYARNVALALFGYRAIGFLAFAAGMPRDLLIIFPNVFEFWFLFVASLPHWHRGFVWTRASTLRWLAFLAALKVFQEYTLHVGQWLDDFTFTEALDAIWDVLSAPF